MPLLHIMDDVFRGVRVGISHTDDNLRWLEGVGRVLADRDWQVKVIGAREDNSYDTAHLVESLGYPATREGWAAARIAPCEAAYAVGLGVLIAADFVLGFGLPPVIINMMLDKGISFLDIEIDPMRFGSELFLTVSTNDGYLAETLSQSIIADETLVPTLAALLAKERRIAPTAGFFPGARVGLFAGQIPHDAALIADGKFVKPAHVVEELRELAAELDLLLVRPHPHWSSVDHLLPILDSVPRAVMTSFPSYALLADPSLTDVMALSSGLLKEARLAGKRSHQLMVPDRDRPLAADLPLRQIRVSWRNVLNALMKRFRSSARTVDVVNELPVMPLHESIQRNWGTEVQPVPDVPKLQLGRELRANNASFDGALSCGWHPRENWGAWAAGQESILVFRLPEEGASGTLRLTFSALEQTRIGVQMVEVHVGPEKLRVAVRITEATGWEGSVDCPISRDMTVAGLIQLRVRSLNFLSPSDMGNPNDNRNLGVGIKSVMLLPEQSAPVAPRDGKALGPEYYTSLHETNIGYQQNNWLLEEDYLLSQIPGDTLQEVGCGNGRYLEHAAKTRRRVIGCDWARSPGVADLQNRLNNVEFFSCDITEQIPQFDADILASADVLEHIATQDIPHTLARLTQAGRWQFHKIACYDDAHSHLTIREPAWWLAQFCAISSEYRLVRSEYRMGDLGRLICIISNFPFAERGMITDPLLPVVVEVSSEEANQRIRELEAEVSRLVVEMSSEEANQRIRELEAEVSRLQSIEQSTIWRTTSSIRWLANRILRR